MPDSLQPAPPEFNERIQRLIAAYPEQLGHLRDARIDVQVRETALQGDQTVQAWGEADTPDNPAEARQFDFTIWFALDKWATLDEFGRDALAFHELSHCSWDESGAPMLVDHDVEIFNAELANYGLWWQVGVADTIDAIDSMPPPHEAEGDKNMPQWRQRAVQGSHGSSGAGSHGSSGAGSHGSSGAGSHGSSGAGSHGSSGAKVAWSDPGIAEGGDFFTVDLGNGEVIELCPDCFRAAAESILSDLLALSFGDAPEQGSHGSSGA